MSAIRRILDRIHLHSCLFLSGLLAGQSLWANITLPFSNPTNIVGVLPLIKFNPSNNVIRFLVFVTMPALFYTIYGLSQWLWTHKTQKVFATTKQPWLSTWGPPTLLVAVGFLTIESLNIFMILVVFVLVLTATTLILPRVLGKGYEEPGQTPYGTCDSVWDRRAFRGIFILLGIWGLAHLTLFFVRPLEMTRLDLFHEGEFVTPAYNWIVKGRLWSGTFFSQGAFYNPVSTLLGWSLFDQQSIGASRIVRNFLVSSGPICFTLFLLGVGLALRRYTTTLQAAMATGIIACGFMIANSLHIGLFNSHLCNIDGPRDFLTLLGMFMVLMASLQSTRKGWMWFLVGLIPPLAIYNSVDKGMYLTLITMGAISAQWLFSEEKRSYFISAILPCFAGFSGVCTLITAYYGWDEVRTFGFQLAFAIGNWDYLYGLQYQEPGFTPGKTAWEYTLPLILIAFQIYVVLIKWPDLLKQRSVLPITVTALFLFATMTHFRTLLGRADPGHIPYGSVFVYPGFAYTLWLISNRFWDRFRKAIIGALFIVLLGYTLIPVKTVLIDGAMLLSFPSRLKTYVSLPDTAFLDEKTCAVLPRMQAIFKDEPCTYVHTNDAAWHYLLRKPSCGRFHITVYASPAPHQKEVIQDLERHKPQYILYECTYRYSMNVFDGIHNRQRVPLIETYIQDKYKFFEDIDGWRILKRKIRMQGP